MQPSICDKTCNGSKKAKTKGEAIAKESIGTGMDDPARVLWKINRPQGYPGFSSRESSVG